MTSTQPIIIGFKTPEEAAEQVRSIHWPEGLFPVDPREIAARMGVDVYLRDLPSEVSGGLVKLPGRDPAIILSASDSLTRRQFTCAHEIGHYVLRLVKGTDAEYAYQDNRAALASQGTDKEEIFANRFAAALLMPSEEVKAKLSLGIIGMLHYFGVSDDALRLRLRRLGLDDGR